VPARDIRSFLRALAFLAGVFLYGSGRADTVALVAVADTTLIEAAPNNNMGGAMIVNAGTTQNFTRNRGLFRFDVAAQVPPGSRITRVDFVVEVTGEPKDGFTASSFGVHRVLKDWGEGDKSSPDPLHPGLGAPATTGEATWNSRFAFTTNLWTVPGGAATNDYVAQSSAVTFVYGIGDSPYTFVTTPELVADVQVWLDNPVTNFGWMLVGEIETNNFAARRFGSHEDTGHAPYILVEYDPPQIDSVIMVDGQFSFSFVVQANQPYTVEFSDSLVVLTNWSTLTNVAAQSFPTNAVISDSGTNLQRYYRLRLP